MEYREDGSGDHGRRITRIAVKKLFGSLDHDVPLVSKDGVTIVYGINGVGKTKLLELTAAVTHAKIGPLLAIPFGEFQIAFDNNTLVSVRKELSKKGKRGNPPHLELILTRTDSNTGKVLRHQRMDPTEYFSGHARYEIPPWVYSLPNGQWFDERRGVLRSAAELAREFSITRHDVSRLRSSAYSALNRSLSEFVECKAAHLIETQRLLRGSSRSSASAHDEDEEAMRLTVTQLAAELKKEIAKYQVMFFQTTQSLDRSLIHRVLSANANVSTAKDLDMKLKSLADHRDRLERVGLLDAGAFGPPLPTVDVTQFGQERALMISIHTEDSEQKFQVLDPLARRLELLLDGMNEKLSGAKRLVLDKERTLIVERGNERIALDQLSSGEQHELVLLYDLAFRVEAGTLVLIDEPELSLHPRWQQQFMTDMIRIAKSNGFYVLLATHSPYIIGTRKDLCVELKSEEKE